MQLLFCIKSMLLKLLIESILEFTIPIYCLIFGIKFYYLFTINKRLKDVIVAISLFGLFIFLLRL